MKIIVNKEPYAGDDNLSSQLYKTTCEIELCDDASAYDYINALVEAMKIETFSEDTIYISLKRYIKELEETGLIGEEDE